MSWPASFLPARDYDLIRIGGNADGGYLVERSSIMGAKSLVALGVCDDWRFEAQFLEFNDVPLVAYDHTTSAKLFTKVLASRVAGFLSGALPFSSILQAVRRPFEYRRFFKGSRRHVRRKVGFISDNATDLATILADPSIVKPTFLKVDIEGWEYRILDQILEHEVDVSGLAIEWHDVDLHAGRIAEFVAATRLTLVHSHPNNYADRDAAGNAIALEMSFAMDPTPIGDLPQVPHPLDRPNNPRQPDAPLRVAG